MLVIRQEQLQVFLEHLMEDFVHRMAAALGVEFPSLHGGSPLPERQAYVRAASAEAQRWELQATQDIEDFVRVCAALGMDFQGETVNWSGEAAVIRADRELSPGGRLHKLQELVSLPAGGAAYRL